MQTVPAPARQPSGARPFARAAQAFEPVRLAAALLVAFLLSLGVLASPGLLLFLSPLELFRAWLEHLAELVAIALVLLAAYALLDDGLPRSMRLRPAAIAAALLILSVGLSVLLHAYYAGGFAHLPPPLRMLADALRWGLPAVCLVLVADVHRRALRAGEAARTAQLARAQLEQGESEQRLALLQAQIEPHFLFNVLGILRRLYRTQPGAGADAMASLMRYLRAALAQLRSRDGTLGDEMALVRAYVDLFRLRMGEGLVSSIELDPAIADAEFPPMLLVTLVENAVRHGVAPLGGGRIEVRAERSAGELQLTVRDDGVGFGSAASSGTGVGLANVRRQLSARYGAEARLVLENVVPRGARATITIPWRPLDAPAGRAASAAAPSGAEALADPGPAWLEDEAVPAPASARSPIAWLGMQRSTLAVAGLLAFAAPLTFLTGAVAVLQSAPLPQLARLTAWWALYGLVLWGMLLATGLVGERLSASLGKGSRFAIWLIGGLLAASAANLATLGRLPILVDQGLAHSAQTAQLYATTFSLVMALLFFAHLHRSRARQAMAARVADAQAGQRALRRRMAQSRLLEVQARVDPGLLFAMLERAAQLYARHPQQGERLLDALIDFLRAALPRMRASGSSLARELEIARAFVDMHALAGTRGASLDVRAGSEALHARFPAGLLLPLLEGALQAGSEALHARFPAGLLLPLLEGALQAGDGPLELSATRRGERCHVTLSFGTAPIPAAVAAARTILARLYGASASLELRSTGDAVALLLEIPHEYA